MTRKPQVLGACTVLAMVAIAAALFAAWKVHQLGAALHEVGLVRLPSLQGLSWIKDAMAELDDSGEAFLTETLSASRLAEERERHARAWAQFERGWTLFEPLPQTPEEATRWRALVPLATAWKQDYADALTAAASALGETHASLPDETRARLASLRSTASPEVTKLLGEIIALNHRKAEEATRRSIASYDHWVFTRNLMLGAAALSILSVLGLAWR